MQVGINLEVTIPFSPPVRQISGANWNNPSTYLDKTLW